MSIFLRMFKHVLPTARAWRLTVDKKLRQFFEGLTSSGFTVKSFFDNIWADIDPDTTRELETWEDQFGLRDTGLSEQQRRDRLDATWKAIGGQDPEYIQKTLRDSGFDVYVHEWWEPGTEPAIGVKGCATPRNPLLLLRKEFTGVTILSECGELNALCGEPIMEAGNGISPRGYPLVNLVTEAKPDFLASCGELLAEAGEADIACGNYFTYVDVVREYTVPSDPTTWPYFLYIGAETFGDMAKVDPSRKDEFEELCLKICPTQQWLGILVEYT